MRYLEENSQVILTHFNKWRHKYFSAGISHEMWPKAVEDSFAAGAEIAVTLRGEHPAKVFLVTSGECSDYMIRGVFSSRPKAVEFINKARTMGLYWISPAFIHGADIEEWELDT